MLYMKAGFGALRALMTGVCLGLAGTALAQTASVDGSLSLDGCDAACRSLHNQIAAGAQPAAEPERRPRRTAVRPAPAGAPRPAPDEVEQTASLPSGSAEILIVARPDDSHRAVLADLAGALAPDVAVRAVPGPGEPLRDVLSLPGADGTIVSSLSLAGAAGSADKLVYVTKLFTEELHALAAPGIARLEDLEGKPVHLGAADSDAELAAKTILESRGIRVVPVAGSLAGSLAGLREGRVAAAFVLAPKPLASLAGLEGGLRLLPLAYRSSDAGFHPAAFTAADSPGLVPPDGRVETVALDAVLVAPRWRENTDRQEELAAFTARLFERRDLLGGPGRHPKWSETNLAAPVDGVRRLKAAQQWISSRLKGRGAVREASVAGGAQ
jgi:uncharacterized protein